MGKASRARREKIRPILEARETEGLVKRARLYDLVHNSNVYRPYVVIDAQNVIDHITANYGSIWTFANNLGIPDKSGECGAGWGEYFPQIVMPFERTFVEFGNNFARYGVYLTENDERGCLYVSYVLSPTAKPFDFIERGSMEFYLTESHDLSWVYNTGYNDDATEAAYVSGVALLCLKFIACRNIELIDQSASPDDNAAFERKFGVPMTKYKVLRVNSIGKQYGREDKPQQQFDIMPLHIRRGNFAHYTDEAPLFGKFTGTFWRPATTVGNAKNGMVVKDYKVTP